MVGTKKPLLRLPLIGKSTHGVYKIGTPANTSLAFFATPMPVSRLVVSSSAWMYHDVSPVSQVLNLTSCAA